jgi:hypothetical protein
MTDSLSGAVTIMTDQQGRVLIPTSNPDYSYIKIKQDVVDFSESGWVRDRTRHALIKGPTSLLERLNYKAGQEIPGRIVVKERTTPWKEDQADREMKMAGTTGIPCRLGDEPIYRVAFYDRHGSMEDILVQHDNQDEIRQANTAFSKVEANLTA